MATLSNIGISINPGRMTSGELSTRMNPTHTAMSLATPIETTDQDAAYTGWSTNVVFGLLTLLAGLASLFGLA